jgi:2-dehydro-3-deoxyphosphogluconate aldolase/(4S)-4-hydroxy-2-oxoglutarate aldolase
MSTDMSLLDIMKSAVVIPVIAIDDPDHAVPLAKALVAGGIRVLEVTLRTKHGLDAIRAMAQVEGAIVGVGTLTQPEEFAASRDAGAVFGVSPGLTPAMTPSEVMVAREAGFKQLKLFPAVPAGGVGMLKAIGGPLPDVTFCPTGGISIETAPQFLALKNVACVGGSWLTPSDAMKAGDWDLITELARSASSLRAAA